MSTERLEPVPDNIAGENVPYRGSVDHGVPYTEQEGTDEDYYHTGRPVEYLPEDEADDVAPIPVRIVTEGRREIKRINVTSASLVFAGTTGKAVIAGRDDKRTGVRIQNNGDVTGAAAVIVIGNENVGKYSGWTLANGADITLTTTEPIYAWATTDDPINSGETILINVLAETVEKVS